MLVEEVLLAQRGHDRLTNRRHTHEDQIEILHILEGEGQFLFEGELFPIKEGCVLLVDSEKFHCSVPLKPERYVRNKLSLCKKDFFELLSILGVRRFSKGIWYVPLKKSNSDALGGRFEALAAARERPFERLSVLCEILEICFSSEQAPMHAQKGSEALEYIDRHLDGPITLDGLAREMHFSKYHLCRIFKQKTGMTPMEYVRVRRLDKAKKMLEDTTLTVSEIALACGYERFSVFSRAFRAQTGKSPTEHRRAQAKRK